jgi:hypothetical protein
MPLKNDRKLKIKQAFLELAIVLAIYVRRRIISLYLPLLIWIDSKHASLSSSPTEKGIQLHMACSPS